MTTIVLKPNEPVDVALRRFRRDIEKTGLIRELRNRTGYEKPTTQRKCEKASAVATQRLRAKRMLPPRKLH
ncbi:30S ribosomal protein S21 [Burkholderia ambifaria]|jgi:small subunit ribosomal protein S21|uniref:30S ribosomal protein S21 n=1 Tax=Burkholderia ambifaria TaxID=152480 RepID=UPI000D0047CA|nr:30S ribosomal protein S21 [Burkholderia ambifaria]MBR8182729.1 30S ribosomal protein S21 [Burkholderia ambifaria]PRG06740.1 30S ribosomal protein S21 [Burkholderia ambifaria]